MSLYRQLLQTEEDAYDFSEFVLMSIGSKLYNRGLYEDSAEFLLGCSGIYPEAKYGYYIQFLAAKNFQKQSRPDLATKHCRESLRLKPDFAQASTLLEELLGQSDE